MNSTALRNPFDASLFEDDAISALDLQTEPLEAVAGLATLKDTALSDLAEMISDRDPLVLQDLIEAFIKEATRQIQNMSRGVVEDELSLLFLPAHSLKSSAATFGAMRLAKLSELLEEEMLGARKKERLKTLVQYIQAEYELVAVAMQTAINEWRA